MSLIIDPNANLNVNPPIVDPLLAIVNGVLNNSVKLLDTAAADVAFPTALGAELGTSLSKAIDSTKSVSSKISDVITTLTNGGSASAAATPLTAVTGEISTLLSQLSPTSSPSVDRLKSILTALNTDLGTLVGSAGTLSAAQLLSALSPMTTDLKVVNDGLVKKLVGGLVGDLNKSIDALLGNNSTLQGLTTAVGSDTANAIQQLFSGLSNTVKSLPTTLETPTALASALQSTVKDANAVVDKLLGLNASDSASKVTGGLKGLTTDLTGIINNIIDGTIPVLTELTGLLAPLSEKINDLVNSLRGISGIGTSLDKGIFVDVLKGKPGIAPVAPDFTSGKQGLTLQGTKKKDKLNGAEFNDVVMGKNGKDQVFGKAGNDRIFAGKGDDTIDGGEGNDLLDGGAGKDILLGNAGDDILIGGKGNDQLMGGAGKDTFTFGSQKGGVDVIKSFETASDLLDLRGIFKQLGATSKDLSQVVKLEQVGANTEVKIDKDGLGAGTTFNTIAKLSNVSALTLSASNFIVS
jgi:RTX calcium-binding nonapeptide repeat (4 copies)